jgi:glucose dehydrogenase
MPAKNYASTRFSELNAINAKNVKDLKVAWTFSTGVNRGQEAAPIVVGDTMYVVTPYPNILYALDLNKPGETKWKYEPKPSAAAQGVACCNLVNRGCVYSDGTIFYNTLDGHTVAVDAKTGKEAWRAWSTGPDADCLIGRRFKPFYQQDMGKDLGVKTWPPDRSKIGGGNVWG